MEESFWKWDFKQIVKDRRIGHFLYIGSEFFNSVQRIVNKFSDTIEDKGAVNFHSIENSILTLTNEVECKDFSEYELLQTRNILMNWLV